MSVVTFNTYEFIKSLEKSGLNEKQAEAITTGMLRIHDASDLATKADLRELTAQMREMELRITIKLGSMIIAAVGVLAVIIKFL